MVPSISQVFRLQSDQSWDHFDTGLILARDYWQSMYKRHTPVLANTMKNKQAFANPTWKRVNKLLVSVCQNHNQSAVNLEPSAKNRTITMLWAHALVRYDPNHSVFIISLSLGSTSTTMLYQNCCEMVHSFGQKPNAAKGIVTSYALLPVSLPGYCTEEDIICVSRGSFQKGITLSVFIQWFDLKPL